MTARSRAELGLAAALARRAACNLRFAAGVTGAAPLCEPGPDGPSPGAAHARHRRRTGRRAARAARLVFTGSTDPQRRPHVLDRGPGPDPCGTGPDPLAVRRSRVRRPRTGDQRWVMRGGRYGDQAASRHPLVPDPRPGIASIASGASLRRPAPRPALPLRPALTPCPALAPRQGRVLGLGRVPWPSRATSGAARRSRAACRPGSRGRRCRDPGRCRCHRPSC